MALGERLAQLGRQVLWAAKRPGVHCVRGFGAPPLVEDEVTQQEEEEMGSELGRERTNPNKQERNAGRQHAWRGESSRTAMTAQPRALWEGARE